MTIKIRKGYNLPIAGAVESAQPARSVPARVVAISPDDYPGFEPKADVQPGDVVERGGILLHSKRFPSVALVSPVSGTVRAVVRGERRKILRVEVEAGNGAARRFARPARGNVAGLRHLLATSGILAMMRQRPYDIIPDPEADVRDIFVSALATAPLAVAVDTPDAEAVRLAGAAVEALSSLTKGKVYICHGAGTPFPAIGCAEMVAVDGPHPAGNVGVQIAGIRPINKGETVWTLSWDVLLRLGCLLEKSEIDSSVSVAITGPEVTRPEVVVTTAGALIEPLLGGMLADDGRNKRIISGNVLTGIAVGMGPDAFLRAPYNQITVIAEGDDVDEFMGWASMSPSKMSVGRSFPLSGLRKLFRPDARLNGGRRSMIMSGEYDRMMPMDILPEYLVKAIMARDIEKMEQLGIYEVAPEDFALAEYADTSKLPLQKIVREGLDYLRKELE